MKSKLLLASALSILTIGALCLSNAALADTTGYAFLSCVSDISEGELSETKNDASVLNDVLSMDYYNFKVTRFRNSQASVSDGSASAALDSFVKAFQDAADEAGKSKDKPFIAYLTGHMFVKDGELYYPLVDYDGEEGSEKVAACPATKICEIMRNCKASVKILFVDCCFSGAGNWDGGVLGKESDFVTFASSQSCQRSRVWLEKQASLFTYWLSFGLRGFADENRNGKVSLKELDRYVTKRVRETAKALGCEQNPVVFNIEAAGNFEFEPFPMRLSERLDEIAELVVTDLAVDATNNDETKKIMLCVPEFSTGKRGADEKTVSPNAGSVPRTQASKLGKKMESLTKDWAEYPVNGVFRRLGRLDCDFGWYAPEYIEDILREKGASIGEFVKARTAVKSKQFRAEYSIGKNKKLALIQVNLEDYDVAGVKVSAEIVFDCVEDFGREYFCNACYGSSELPDLGLSANNKPPSRGTTLLPIASSSMPPGDQLKMMIRGKVSAIQSSSEKKEDDDAIVRNLTIARAADVTADKPAPKHPLEEEHCNYGVSFVSRPVSTKWEGDEGYKPVEMTFKNGEAFVEFDLGDEYAIVIENKEKKPADEKSLSGSIYARITVDGRETVSYEPLREENDASLESWRQDWRRVSVGEANGWLVPPQMKGAVYGFSKPNLDDPKGAQLRRFQVVGADKLGEERDTYAEQIGLITFQIHRAGDVERGNSAQDAGTLPQPPEKTEIKMVEAAITNVLGVFSIRYRLKDKENNESGE